MSNNAAGPSRHPTAPSPSPVSENRQASSGLTTSPADSPPRPPYPTLDHRQVIYELARLIGRQIGRDLLASADDSSGHEEH